MTVLSKRRNITGGSEQSLNVYETIVLCQPDGSKSCSACCGLFNFRDISRGNLARFLEEGASRSSACIAAGDYPDQGDRHAIREITSYICPHQGLIFNKRPGCLLHPQYRTSTMRNESFFGEKICNGFLCPAHSILSTEQKKHIIGLLDDWYAYTIAVIDPDSTAWLLDLLRDKYTEIFKRVDIMKKIVHTCLMIHADHLSSQTGPVFCYSISEYAAAKINFSLACGEASRDEENEIEDAIRSFL
jgi:hypothetical protein